MKKLLWLSLLIILVGCSEPKEEVVPHYEGTLFQKHHTQRIPGGFLSSSVRERFTFTVEFVNGQRYLFEARSYTNNFNTAKLIFYSYSVGEKVSFSWK